MVTPDAIVDLRNLAIKNKKRVWRPFMEGYHCQAICELGVRNGQNFDLMIKHHPQLAVAVDIWRDDANTAHNDAGFSQTALDRQYQNFTKRMRGKPFVRIYRGYTDQASAHFPNNSFDFIYVDADHSYNGCLMDLQNWYPKVKKNRFLIGDDYRNDLVNPRVDFGVVAAVNNFAKDNKLTVYRLPRWGWAIIKT
ncbi:hypothetical protein A3F62_01480 [Candidatus Woesebacteria bacterium RIFCSPHIGHO2_12_FULL_44_11]|uniref:Methyltransferase n=1 Tax=Candidatus Woesebacteria bacterium RIFCSPLOWO2_01_FULL_44_14 TaxID=1802525 RepID=A0A1F8C383_9BACT|nr:MAG: hypothetical protein A3F62_01480 [Candidatus Woesebacteria bacterium RIFCSPHIGHO2_12_FULL_44_11]OGM70620.1 MAG: hypothetical protein A2975_00195 [Candidatus Woesebacteria bacterium RIFCSPLOWO2_01_FULL_44_14]